MVSFGNLVLICGLSAITTVESICPSLDQYKDYLSNCLPKFKLSNCPDIRVDAYRSLITEIFLPGDLMLTKNGLTYAQLAAGGTKILPKEPTTKRNSKGVIYETDKEYVLRLEKNFKTMPQYHVLYDTVPPHTRNFVVNIATMCFEVPGLWKEIFAQWSSIHELLHQYMFFSKQIRFLYFSLVPLKKCWNSRNAESDAFIRFLIKCVFQCHCQDGLNCDHHWKGTDSCGLLRSRHRNLQNEIYRRTRLTCKHWQLGRRKDPTDCVESWAVKYDILIPNHRSMIPHGSPW